MEQGYDQNEEENLLLDNIDNILNANIQVNEETNVESNHTNNNISSTLQDFQRATNEEILNLFRRVLSLRERSSINTNIRNELLEFEENFYEFLFSNKCFLFSFLLLIPLIGWLGLELYSIINKQDFTLRILETHQMWISYGLLLLILTILMWNFYLFMFKLFSGFFGNTFSNLKLRDMFEPSTADVLYFNPFYFNILVFHYDKIYLCTNFDLFSVMFIAIHYLINFYFVNLVFNYFKIKIARITNLHLFENKLVIYKMRIFFSFLILMNVLFSHITQYITSEDDFYFIYLMQHKSIYLIIKIAGMWHENEATYKQLDSNYATNEQYYLNSMFIKMVFQMVAMVLIVQILFFGNMLFFKRGTFIFFVPCFFILTKTILEFLKTFKKYEEIKLFFDKLESVFPQETLSSHDTECSICTEILTKARKLSCNHYFHLICLSKWIERGKKNCPLCRKEIQENVESLNRNSREEYIFRFSLSTRFFNWLPNITIRLGRHSSNDNNRNSDN